MYVIIFTVKPSAFSNLDPVSSYVVRFLCNLYGRKARTESYNFRVEYFSKIGPKTVPIQQFQWQNLAVSGINQFSHMFDNNNYLIQKNLVHIYIATLFIFLFHQAKPQFVFHFSPHVSSIFTTKITIFLANWKNTTSSLAWTLLGKSFPSLFLLYLDRIHDGLPWLPFENFRDS